MVLFFTGVFTNLPEPVLAAVVIVAIIGASGGPKITFDMQIRDTLLLVFFTTIGISAKFSRLKAGGQSSGSDGGLYPYS